MSGDEQSQPREAADGTQGRVAQVPTLWDLRTRRVGLALAGGGVLAAAHVGVLDALAEHGITVQAVAGVSAGALVATLWGAGLDSRILRSMSGSLGFRDLDIQLGALFFPWLRHVRPGLIRGRRLEHKLAHLVPAADLTDLPRACAIVATDLAHSTPVVFTSRPPAPERIVSVGGRKARIVVGGPPARLLRGSMAVPFLFAPVPHEGLLLADGGIAETVPVEAVRAFGVDYVIGVDLTPSPEDLGDVHRMSPLDALARGFRYLQDSVPARPADLTIRPRFPARTSILDFRRQAACMQAGYEAAQRALDALPHTVPLGLRSSMARLTFEPGA